MLSLLVTVGGARGDPPEATASVTPHVQFLGDMAGTVFTFTVASPGGGDAVGSVEIDRPSSFWTVIACPRVPAGWTAQKDAEGCRFDSHDSSTDLPAGTTSSDFQVTAASGEATTDQKGAFLVGVGGPTVPDSDDGALPTVVATTSGGLDVTAFSYEVLDVVVAGSPPAPGSVCPPGTRTVTAGAGQALAVCGRNHTSQPLVPLASFSTLGGTLLQAPGTFTSGPVPPGNASVVLGSWGGGLVVPGGQGRSVVASIGSSPVQTSPAATLAGYDAAPPPLVANPQRVTAREDSAMAIVLTGSGGDGSALTVGIATGPAHGRLGGLGADLVYAPDAGYAGDDGFTFTVSDGLATSAPAGVAITVEPVNHAPSFVRGPNLTVVATAGPERFPGWATGISAGPPNEASQALRFVVAGDSNPGVFSQEPALSSAGDLTFAPNAASSGSTTVTLVLVDDGGTANGGVDTSPPQAFTISVVRPVVRPPRVTPPSVQATNVTTDEDTATTVILAATDPAGGVLAFSVTPPAHGTLGSLGAPTCSGAPKACTAAVAYTPEAGYAGQDGFTYTVTNRQGTRLSAPASAPVGVTVRRKPVVLAMPPVRRGPTLSALSPAKDPSGPPGVGLELTGSGYGCHSVYFFFDGSRIGLAHPNTAGRVRMTGLEVPGDIGLGRHVVETSCQLSGRPVLVRTSFDVTRTSLHRSVVMTSLPKPSDVDLHPKALGASMVGAIVLILLVAVPGGLLDTTLEEHYVEIRGWFGLHPKPRAAHTTPPAALRLLGLVGFLIAGGVAGALLDPSFGLNRSTLALALGLCLSLGLVFLGFELPSVAYMRRHHREWGSIVLRPGALALTAILVGTSRLLHLQPGFLFGVIGGLAFSGQLREKAEGRLAVATSVFILVVAFAMWFLWVPVSRAATNPGADFWLIVAEVALGGTFAAGLQSLVVGLLPLREMDGSTVKSWSMAGWAVVYLVGVLAYVEIILRPAAAAGADPHGQMWKALAAAAIFAAGAIGFWAYFRLRARRAESP